MNSVKGKLTIGRSTIIMGGAMDSLALKLRYLCLSVTMIGSVVAAQTRAVIQDVKSQKVMDLVQYLQANSLESETWLERKRSMSETELKHAAALMFKASVDDYQEMRRVLKELRDVARHQETMGSGRPLDAKFVNGELQDLIKVRISRLIYALVRVPYIVKVRVIKSSHEKTSDPMLLATCITYVQANVEEVFKGTSHFKSGDYVEFYFFDFWHNQIGDIDLTPGMELLVPLEPREMPSGEMLALVPYIDASQGYYPIENGSVLDRDNLFKNGTAVPYEIVREDILKAIDDLNSW